MTNRDDPDGMTRPEDCFGENLSGRVHEVEAGFDHLPVEVAPQYEGQRVRRPDMHVELGGPKVEHKFELFQVRPPKDVEDGTVKVFGPDLDDMEPGSSNAFGLHVKVSGEELEEDLEGVLERRNHYFTDYVDGVMHLNQRTDVWIRINEEAHGAGLDSLEHLGTAIANLFRAEFPIIEEMEVDFYTDPEKVAEMVPGAEQIYRRRDQRARSLTSDDVDTFYDCTMCQSFAPSHVCVITPDRIGGCGSISWIDARASHKVDPEGPNQPLEPGELLDPEYGVYEGVNRHVAEKSLGAVTEITLHSVLTDTPHTSCGCFEAILFYVPEVDGIGVVHRKFPGPTVNGVKFSTMAGSVSGGTQQRGFLGVAIEYLRSSKFVQADGGWNRVAWMPRELKEALGDHIPEGVRDSIATERDVENLAELEEHLEENGHPLAERSEFGTGGEDDTEEEEGSDEEEPREQGLRRTPDGGAAGHLPELRLPALGGKARLTLTDVKIVAARARLEKLDETEGEEKT